MIKEYPTVRAIVSLKKIIKNSIELSAYSLADLKVKKVKSIKWATSIATHIIIVALSLCLVDEILFIASSKSSDMFKIIGSKQASCMI